MTKVKMKYAGRLIDNRMYVCSLLFTNPLHARLITVCLRTQSCSCGSLLMCIVVATDKFDTGHV